MKSLLDKFVEKSFPVLSKREMRQVKGGETTFGCRNGATGYGTSYDICGPMGVAWINFNP